MSLSEASHLASALQPFVYGILAVAAFVQWRRHRAVEGAWLAAAFGVMGLVIVGGLFLPDGSTDPAVLWAGKVRVAILVLFPYLLYRFMTSIIGPVRWRVISAAVVTGALALGALLLPPFPETARPLWFQIYVAVFLFQWVTLSALVAVRLWRAGRGQPTVVRRRMAMMSLGAAGLAVALVVAGELPDAGAFGLLVQVLVLMAAPLMLIGFAPPYAIRAMWRRHEQNELNDAALALMGATSDVDVAQTLLPHARRLVGAAVAMLEDAEGRFIASDGLGEDEAREAIASASEEALVVLTMRSGRLTVIASPFTPFFGTDEVETLQGLAALADLALGRTQLLENQRQLAEIVQSSPSAVVAKSLDGTIRGWNRGAEELYGYTADEVLGRSIRVIVPADHDDIATNLEKVRKGERVERYQTKRRTKDGRIIDVSLAVSPLTNSEGEVIGASATAQDITELKRAEDALQESEERNRTIIDTAKDAYVEIDNRSIVREWNASAAEMFGIPKIDAIGRELPDLVIPARYREAHRAGVAKYLATGEAAVLNTTVELTALRGGSEEFPVELTVWPVGHPPDVTFHAFVRDISERKTVERALTSAREAADRANQAKSEFLSRMSHELRTPMNAVLGFAQLLAMDPLSPEQREGTTEIIKAGNHLLALIDEVLDISRIEAGNLRLSLEPVNVVEVVEECLSLLTPLADKERISVSVQRDGVPEGSASVIADRQRLKQVLLNLISNGIKYNRENGSIRVWFEATEPDRFRVHVADTGHGIPPERMAQLFAPFQRLGAEVTEVQGTGLGLALSKGLVEAMGGTISATSRLGEGSTFSVELDLGDDILGLAEPDDRTEETRMESTPLTSRTVLYVEDNLSNLKLVERLVARRPNIALVSAMQGSIGLTLARDHTPDLVLLDLDLPDMNGKEVLTRLQSDPRTASLPVVVLTADATAGQIRRLLDAGARAYLTKPLDVERFFQILDEFCPAA